MGIQGASRDEHDCMLGEKARRMSKLLYAHAHVIQTREDTNRGGADAFGPDAARRLAHRPAWTDVQGTDGSGERVVDPLKRELLQAVVREEDAKLSSKVLITGLVLVP
jgi:hypothetical protein